MVTGKQRLKIVFSAAIIKLLKVDTVSPKFSGIFGTLDISFRHSQPLTTHIFWDLAKLLQIPNQGPRGTPFACERLDFLNQNGFS